METLQSFSNKLADALRQLQPDDSLLQWDFRGEVGDKMVYERTMIGIVSFNSSTEEIYGNRTQRLSGSLTGQIMIDQMTSEEINQVLNELQTIIYNYIGGLRYSEVGDAVVLQGTCDSILTHPKNEYWNFVLPMELIVQF